MNIPEPRRTYPQWFRHRRYFGLRPIVWDPDYWMPPEAPRPDERITEAEFLKALPYLTFTGIPQ